ncbi:SAM dependent carboxyl methyltransferase [Dillenia turbinata]|uniref:SAM dependent carboxyl methyltransferase n=1 Tax=Dillenia turbinata TaxID=194707 RepID=A0AAN8Z186_9MAGN
MGREHGVQRIDDVSLGGYDMSRATSNMKSDIQINYPPYRVLIGRPFFLMVDISKMGPSKIADLGCSVGPNTLSFIKDIIEIVEATSQTISRPVPQFLICLNDLPTNDFNSIFKQLPDFYEELNKGKGEGCSSVYVAAFPGSFYGRLFPNDFLHFTYSSFALHWLSKGQVKEEKLDSYDIHFYAASKGEIEDGIKKEGSFEMEQFEMIEFEDDLSEQGPTIGEKVAAGTRAIQESMISHHFGEQILDNLFDTFAKIVDEEVAKEKIKIFIFFVALVKL